MGRTAAATLNYDRGNPMSYVYFDTGMMRSQPTPDFQLAVVGRHQADGGGVHAPNLLYHVSTMLALS